MGTVGQRLVALKQRLFVPHEILLRTDGRVRYFTVTPRLQMAACGVAFLGFSWFLYSSVQYVANERRLTAQSLEIVHTRDAYASLLGEVAQYYEHFTALTQSLTAAEQLLLDLTRSDAAALPAVPETPSLRLPLLPESDRLTPEEMRRHLRSFGSDLERIVDRNQSLTQGIAALQEQLRAAEAEKQQANERLSAEIAALSEELALSESEKRRTSQVLTGDITALREKLRASEAEKLRVNESLNANIAALKEQLRISEQEKSRLDQALHGDIDSLREQLKLTEEEKKRINEALSIDIAALREKLDRSEAERQRVNEALNANIAALRDRLRESEAEKQRIDAALNQDIAALQEKLRTSEEEKARLNGRMQQDIAALQEKLRQSEEEKRRLDNALNFDIATLQEQLKLSELEKRRMNQALHGDIADLQRQLRLTEEEKQKIVAARERIGTRLQEAEAMLAGLNQHNSALQDTIDDLEEKLAAAQRAQSEALARAERAESSEADVARSREALEAEIADLERTLDETQLNVAALEDKLDATRASKAELERRIATVQQALATVIGQRNALQTARTELSGRVDELENRLVAMQASQEVLVSKIVERTRNGVEEVEKTLAMTGLDVEMMLQRAYLELSAQGGPFVPALALPRDALTEKLMASVVHLDVEVERWERLQYILKTLPLTAPVDHYTIGSKFGMRTDPFNGKLALHEGIDLAGGLRSPVLATAPGRVVKAGWEGSYGRMVEIDHGLGIRTRYAHLQAIEVKVGDPVYFRQRVGLLGSSGRSTGPHVHYEVLVNGKPVDPMNFLKAGRYVFKG